ncbi:MAG TPA: glutamine synthetase III [Bacteroidia bacterium]|nr:glutamine synthetase III [Bacteroidia bacterium]
MTLMRFKALELAQNRTPVKVDFPSVKISDYYGTNVFGEAAMRQYLGKEAINAINDAKEEGTKIDRKMADVIAAGMKQWAISKGVTHYSHWFQPLTGATAEKHDAFFEPIDNSSSMERFSGNALVQQEPDASSFPSGGLRNTFEARGYTAWDPSSPAFVIGRTLCIPTIFVSYTGEALDFKAPLLKSLYFLDTAATEVCKLFDKKVNKVTASLGIEQEYFLVDEALFYARPDLMLTGRTLVGYSSAKGQQLEDHYFGSIPDRVMAYMMDFETEALKLGIPLKTRHNEVAPGQFECAPQFEEVNLAVDHNALLMDIMDKVARRHHFKVLLHEKPFAGVNGSGKHNNWSMITNTGVNLLSPGSTPLNNLQFLTFFINTIKAVDEHADLMRASIASASNQHRLGANEAPPSIISIFIGTQLTQVLNNFENNIKDTSESNVGSIHVNKIPEILLDNTDRNRTSPFAFTGNKFEYRAVGSLANSASPMIVLNTIVADQLKQFKAEVEKLVASGKKQEEAIVEVLRRYVAESKRVLFEGNGYSEDWAREAERRGLTNIKDVPNALAKYVSDKALKLFSENGIMNEREIEARYEILLENFVKKIQIESRVLGDLANTHIIPAAISFQNKLVQYAHSMKELGMEEDAYKVAMDTLKEASKHLNIIKTSVYKMVEERKVANALDSMEAKAHAYSDKVKPYFDIIRAHSDKLERIVEDTLWPLPKYRELLFVK